MPGEQVKSPVAESPQKVKLREGELRLRLRPVSKAVLHRLCCDCESTFTANIQPSLPWSWLLRIPFVYAYTYGYGYVDGYVYCMVLRIGR